MGGELQAARRQVPPLQLAILSLIVESWQDSRTCQSVPSPPACLLGERATQGMPVPVGSAAETGTAFPGISLSEPRLSRPTGNCPLGYSGCGGREFKSLICNSVPPGKNSK